MNQPNYPAPLPPHELHTLIAAAQAGDTRARNRVITHNMRLVWRLAHNFARRNGCLDELEDLVQAGAFGSTTRAGLDGLAQAIARFDASRGYRFSTLASRWIVSALRSAHLSMQCGLVACAGRSSSRRGQPAPVEVSIDQHDACSHPMPADLLDALSTSGDPVEGIDLRSRVRELQACFGLLDDRERYVVTRRFSYDEPSQSAVGAELGLSREWVRQIEAGALRKLRAAMLPDAP